MKKTVRVLAALLVAVILATSASAAKAIFVSPNGSGTTEQKATVAPPTFTPPAETKTTATTAPGGFVFNGPAPVYTASDFPKTPAPTCLYPSYPVYTGCTAPCQPCGTYGYYGGWYRPAPYDILAGGKYYTVADARAEIDQYLARTAYNLIMTEGERRTICEGAYTFPPIPPSRTMTPPAASSSRITTAPPRCMFTPRAAFRSPVST